MSLHVSVSGLHGESDLASSLDSRDLSSLSLGNELWVVDVETGTLTESTEELETAVVFDWSEHSDSLLDHAWGDWDVSATIGLNIFITI